MGLWVSLLSVDETWKENRVTDKENGSIVANQIPVAFLSVEFDSKSTRISSSIGTSRFTALKKKGYLTSFKHQTKVLTGWHRRVIKVQVHAFIACLQPLLFLNVEQFTASTLLAM